VDGYTSVIAGGVNNQVSLTFTTFAKACGYVRNGVQKNDSTSLTIAERDTQAITTKAYAAAVFASVSASGSRTPATAGANGTCRRGSVSTAGRRAASCTRLR
jgi:hypothetical protein